MEIHKPKPIRNCREFLRGKARLAQIASLMGAASILALAGLAGGAVPDGNDASSCEQLIRTKLAHAKVTTTSIEDLGGFKACRVAVTSKPTPDSDIRIEVWIPDIASWNGKFVQAGNSGYAGRIPVARLKEFAARGYVAAGTDDGHQAELTDGSWALGHPQKLVDYGWRSLKETTEAAKLLILAARGKTATKSYFVGCSDGGREALMEAQRYPNDFDGIVAGAPANYQARLMTMRAGYYETVRKPGGYLDTPQLTLIQHAVLAQCGGTTSGFVRSPTSCKFDPGQLLCKPGEQSQCLSPEQLASIRAIYGGWRDPTSGALMYPGFEPGAEAQKIWKATILGESAASLPETSSGYQYAASYLKYFAFQDPNFDPATLDMGAQARDGVAKTASIVDAEDADLSAFKAHGAKLLQYHGWNDQNIPPRSSLRYFEEVQRYLGNTSTFYRLFMVPGMLHCQGGAGPNQVDWLAELDRWVTDHTPPQTIVATMPETKAPGDGPTNGASQLLCPYPQEARYQGGDENTAASYRCVAGK